MCAVGFQITENPVYDFKLAGKQLCGEDEGKGQDRMCMYALMLAAIASLYTRMHVSVDMYLRVPKYVWLCIGMYTYTYIHTHRGSCIHKDCFVKILRQLGHLMCNRLLCVRMCMRKDMYICMYIYKNI